MYHRSIVIHTAPLTLPVRRTLGSAVLPWPPPPLAPASTSPSRPRTKSCTLGPHFAHCQAQKWDGMPRKLQKMTSCPVSGHVSSSVSTVGASLCLLPISAPWPSDAKRSHASPPDGQTVEKGRRAAVYTDSSKNMNQGLQPQPFLLLGQLQQVWIPLPCCRCSSARISRGSLGKEQHCAANHPRDVQNTMVLEFRGYTELRRAMPWPELAWPSTRAGGPELSHAALQKPAERNIHEKMIDAGNSPRFRRSASFRPPNSAGGRQRQGHESS